MREFCRENGIPHLIDINGGVCHQVLPELGFVRPGMTLVATDSHTVTHGAFGAFGTGVGATDLAVVLLTGRLWLRVPEVVRVNIEGKLPLGVTAKDVILKVIGTLGQDAAVYQAVEFTGSTITAMGIAERMVMCNMTVEMGAKTAYIQPDDAVLDYVRQRVGESFTVYTTDPGYQYAGEYQFSVDELVPQVAVPHSIDNVKDITSVEPVPIDQVLIGTCTNGRVEDIAIAAKILGGHRIPSSVRLVVIPASAKVLRECIDKGYIQTLIDSGATVAAPGCGPCLGVHEGLLADGERCVATSSRNFPGRMGSTGAEIYVASPATAAASARAGRLMDPRVYLSEKGGTGCAD